ncbi:tenascin isoform X1 [Toxotes jaculatrix]|uniref:tenascin isoform X1 n=1 Tax=Toxotes jaculatrix TaxID=941984 RepID=UPI001B3AFBA6|nr:tenascin isoform X1 [Toxotes jaculatrix]XP_040908816.1 tenascin isoform X1 [Toxotes jaculatrix]
MLPFVPSLLLILLLAGPALLTPSTSQELQVRGHRTPRDTKQDSIKVVISEGCATQGDSSDASHGGKEIDLAPGSPLVLTHKIKLVPSGSGSGSGSCGCEADFAALRERLERLEREVSALREKCGGAEGGCCTSKESKGAGCSIKPDVDECPNECSDQGRCVDGKCVCFPGFSGPDCSESNCPGNCNDNGRCVNGQCVCDPGFTGPDCSKRACPSNCNDRGRCVNGKCVCDRGFTGADCSENSCPGNCNNRGRCVNGQCVCNPGFTGPDCSKKACPDNCSNRGRCVNGKCVCDSGFSGVDCSEIACPGNCNNRGRCVNGQCVCSDGFSGSDCSESTCPNDCSDHGRCVDGKCVCDSGFTGDDCSENSCPGNCNNRGRCVNGQCVCDDGFTGTDCSEKACPNNCSNRGKCVNGKCVCNVGFAGPDCSAKGCPNNCNNKGRCVKGRCMCRRGFTGQDCSLCEEGMTGPNCDTDMSGVPQLSTQDITETSVTLLWTPPPVQYETYHISFTNQKESDQQITTQVEGSLTTFTQTGLAAGQEYTVTITGEIDGRRGAASSTEFMTLISGPTNLQVVKTTSTSAVVQWEKSQGEIDRYRLTATPSDGTGRSQEMTVPVDQNSAHILQLEAGRLYDIILVAEKGTSRSKPATTQAVPALVETLPRVITEALTKQVTLAPGQDVDPSAGGQVFDQQGRREVETEANAVKAGDRHSEDSLPFVIARTKPLVSRTMATNGTRPKLANRFTLSRKPKDPGPFRFSKDRVVPGGRKVGPGPLKKTLMGEKAPIVPKKPKPGASRIGNRTMALTVRERSTEPSSTERREDKDPAIMSGIDSETDRQSSLEEPKEQPDVGMAGQGNDTAPVSSEPTGTVQSQEKKCLNKIKVPHMRLPHKDGGNGCRGDGTVLVGNTLGSDQGSFETESRPSTPPSDMKPSSAETDLDYTPDPLLKLLTDTWDSLNITTFSVHLSKPSNLSADSDTVRRQILMGLKPLSSFSSSSSSSSTSQSSHSSGSQSSSSSLLSLTSPSQASPSSTAAPSSSLTYLFSSSPSSSLSPPSPSSSSSDKSESFGSNELDADNSRSTTDTAAPEERKQPPSGEDGVPLLRHTPPKPGFMRRPHPNLGSFQNKTFRNLRVPHRSPLHFNVSPRRVTEVRHTSTNKSSSSSASEESSSVEVNTSVRDASLDKDGATTPASSVVEQNQKKMQTERGRIPVRRPPLKGGYVRRHFPNMGHLQNRTHPSSRLLTHPTRPLNPKTETQKEQISPSELPATSSPPVSKESYPAEDTEPIREQNGMRISTTSTSNGSNQTLRGRGVPSSHRPGTKDGYFRRPQLHGGAFLNKTRPNLRLPQYPRRGLMHKPFPIRKLNGGTTITDVSQTSQLAKDSTPEIPDVQSGQQDVPRPTQGVQIRQAEKQETAEVDPSASMDGYNATIRPQINELEKGGSAPIQTTKFGEEETSTADSNFDPDIHKQSVDAGKSTVPAVRGRPTFKQTSPRASRPVTLPKRQSPSRSITGQHRTQMKQYISGSQKGEDPITNHTAKRMFDSKTGLTRNAASKPPITSDISSTGVRREPLDYVGVTNRTSEGFTLKWDSPEGKYKNFVVTRKQVGKDARAKQKESNKDQERQEEYSETEGGSEDEEEKHQPTTEPKSENRSTEDENTIPERVVTHTTKKQSSTAVKSASGSDTTVKEVLPGSARSLRFEDLPPQTEYTVTLLGKGPGLLSRLHKLVISTGPEPPTNIAFSKVTENSLTVSWTKPKSAVSGFKVTYTHAEDGEPVSVSLDSKDSTLGLSQLSPGSTYEVSIISILGLDESDPIKDTVMTLPDPPTDLRAVNITDTKALLLWRPALATIDRYAIVYGSGTDSEVRITVSGNAAEQQLTGLEGSTTYTVTITSQLGSLESSPATTSFTTTGGSGRDRDGPRDLQANNVTPRTALLSWKPPSKPAGSYRLTYQTEGHEMKEVMVDASVTEYNLTRLYPGSKYTVHLQAEGGGRYTSAISTEFTTGPLRFPFPTDCSQELLNGVRMSGEVEIFPQGKQGTPMMVYCDMETDGGGWTVFQRRKDGSVDFFKGWKEYVNGFGDLSGEFWLGLNSLHNLTAMSRMSLRVDLRDAVESVFAKYSVFEVAKRNYRLTVGGYSGTAGDSLSYHNNRVFSTKDRDPAPFITRCAMSYRGGWWYKNCHEANLNGLYGIDVKHQGVIWTAWKGKEHSIPFTEMKMRPTSFSPPARG